MLRKLVVNVVNVHLQIINEHLTLFFFLRKVQKSSCKDNLWCKDLRCIQTVLVELQGVSVLVSVRHVITHFICKSTNSVWCQFLNSRKVFKSPFDSGNKRNDFSFRFWCATPASSVATLHTSRTFFFFFL